jgi:hypothetical protein
MKLKPQRPRNHADAIGNKRRIVLFEASLQIESHLILGSQMLSGIPWTQLRRSHDSLSTPVRQYPVAKPTIRSSVTRENPSRWPAAGAVTVLEQLGFKNVRVYDSSWLGCAAKLKAPVEDETFFNVGAVSGKMTAMQKRIDDLERAIEQLDATHRHHCRQVMPRAALTGGLTCFPAVGPMFLADSTHTSCMRPQPLSAISPSKTSAEVSATPATCN